MACGCGGKVGELSSVHNPIISTKLTPEREWFWTLLPLHGLVTKQWSDPKFQPHQNQTRSTSVCWVGCLLWFWCVLEGNFVVCFILSPSIPSAKMSSISAFSWLLHPLFSGIFHAYQILEHCEQILFELSKKPRIIISWG